MTKQIFLDALRAALASLPVAEIEKTLAYYEEMLNDRIEEGMSEEAAVASMEPVEVLASRVINDTPIMHKAVRKAQKSGVSTALLIILAILGFPIWFPLLCAAGAVILATIAVLFAVIFSLIAVVLGLGVGGITAVIGAFFYAGTSGISTLFIVGAGLMVIGITILLLFPVIFLIKAVWTGIKAICRKIASWFRKKEGK